MLYNYLFMFFKGTRQKIRKLDFSLNIPCVYLNIPVPVPTPKRLEVGTLRLLPY